MTPNGADFRFLLLMSSLKVCHMLVAWESLCGKGRATPPALWPADAFHIVFSGILALMHNFACAFTLFLLSTYMKSMPALQADLVS